jgi:hypothetical protein
MLIFLLAERIDVGISLDVEIQQNFKLRIFKNIIVRKDRTGEHHSERG